MKAKSKLTINEMIGKMKPGVRYSAHDLARRLKHPVSSVRQLLSLDVALARLDCHSENRGRMYSLAGTINFDGLSGDEIRAQCAMVVGAVRDHLLKPERNAVWLRYACGMPARPASATRAADPGIPPSAEWKRALVEMRTYLRPSLTVTNGKAIMALIAGHSQARLRQDGLSYREISEETHVTVRTLERNAQIVRKRLAELEREAVKRLTPLFERNNVTIAEAVEA